MLSPNGRIPPELSSSYLTYLDRYSTDQDSDGSLFLEETIITGQFQWRQLVDESNRSPPSKTRLKEIIASIYFGNLDDTPKPLSHWLFTLETQQELKFLKDLSPTLDLNAKDPLGNSALHCAVLSNTPEAIPPLLAQGANPDLPNHAGDYPIHLAVHRDPIEALTALKTLLTDPRVNLERVDRSGYTPLKRAILRKQFLYVFALTERGARVDTSLLKLATRTLRGNGSESNMIQYLTLANIKQNMHTWKYKAYALAATLLVTASSVVAGLYLTGLLQKAANAHEATLPNASQAFEEYFE